MGVKSNVSNNKDFDVCMRCMPSSLYTPLVLLIQLESLLLCALRSSTMMSIAILVLEYCKHKHGQIRGFCTILTKINDVDKEYQVQRNSYRTLSVRANVQNSLVANPVHGVLSMALATIQC